MTDWTAEQTPATKNDTWTAAGSHHVNIKLNAGKPQVIAFIAVGLSVDAPVSPPLCLHTLVSYHERMHETYFQDQKQNTGCSNGQYKKRIWNSQVGKPKGTASFKSRNWDFGCSSQ